MTTCELRQPEWRPLRILLVEDDDGDAKAVRRAFEKSKAAISMNRVKDGEEALTYMNSLLEGAEGERDDVPILLIDINMPRLDGHELLKAIREHPILKKSIVFVLTTSSAPVDLERAYNANVAGYILKRNVGADFVNLIELIDSFHRVVELPVLMNGGMQHA